MIGKDINGSYVIENSSLRITLDKTAKRIESLENLHSSDVGNGPCELFMLDMHGRVVNSSEFSAEVSICSDEVYEMLTINASLESELVYVRISFINDGQDTINILYQVRDDYKYGVQTRMKMHIPLMEKLSAGEDSRKYYPGCTVSDKNGNNVLVPMRESLYSSDILMPLVVCDRDDRYGYSVEFPTLSDLNNVGATQNINKLLTYINSEDALKNHWVEINPDSTFNDTVELKITGIKNGWAEAFRRVRSAWRQNYDFSEYGREDLSWMKKCVVNHFAFLYGREAFDGEKINVDRLLSDGEAFGGYDSVTIWNQYPRLGIDSRSQWDFHDDFPGGRKAIRDAVSEMHERGVYVFLPYIPWDQGINVSAEAMSNDFAKLVRDTDADGYQLDTLIEIPHIFREKLDEIREGLVLQTQHHPAKKRPTEFITTSWDEFWRTDPMPEDDVFRFMCPEHIAPVISRWLRTEDKTILIKRAEFGAAPIVIWQDIFGRWMPYTDEQKRMIRRWKNVYLENIDIYQGDDPVPLMPTFTQDLYCNSFGNSGGDRVILSFFNDSDERKEEISFRTEAGVKDCSVILGEGFCRTDGKVISFDIGPFEVKHILVRTDTES